MSNSHDLWQLTSRIDKEAALVPPEGAIACLGRGMIEDLAFSIDKCHLVVGSRTGVWWYNLTSLSPIALWEAEKGMINTITFSTDGRWFASGNLARVVKIWDMQRGVCTAQPDREIKFSAIAHPTFSLNGQYLAVFDQRRDAIYIVDPETGKQHAILGNGQKLKSRRPSAKPITFSPDPQILANVSQTDNMSSDFVSVWHIETGERIACFTKYPDYVYALSFSPCGRFLAIGCWNGTLRVWNLNTRELELEQTEYGKYRMYPNYLSDGTLIVAGLYHGYEQEPVDVWNAEDGEKLASIKINGNVSHARFSPCGMQLAVANHGGDIKISHIADSNVNILPTLQGHTGVVDSVGFIPERNVLAAGYRRDNILLWNVESQRPQKHLMTHSTCPYYYVHISHYEKVLTIGSDQNSFKVWNEKNGQAPITEFETPEKHPGQPLALTRKADRLASGYKNGTLIVWDMQIGCKQYTFTEHTDRILAVAFSSDGRRLASTSRNDIRIWDVENGEEIATLPESPPSDPNVYKGDTRHLQNRLEALSKGNKCLCSRIIQTLSFSLCGTIVAGGMPEEILLWDTTTYENLMVLLLPQGNQHQHTLAFSPCGRFLASDSWTESTRKVSIQLWDLATGEIITTFWGHFADISSLGFSSDSTLLASGSADGTILLWDIKPFIVS